MNEPSINYPSSFHCYKRYSCASLCALLSCGTVTIVRGTLDPMYRRHPNACIIDHSPYEYRRSLEDRSPVLQKKSRVPFYPFFGLMMLSQATYVLVPCVLASRSPTARNTRIHNPIYLPAHHCNPLLVPRNPFLCKDSHGVGTRSWMY
jgi:hypothetical protein